MKTQLRLTICAAAALLAAWLFTGCGTSKQKQLEHVARDWCMTIRASQVIPVYPLTEDIQPGDVFLVQTPIDRQQEVYKDKGFLPLDNHIARVNPSGYPGFYRNSFIGVSNSVVLPLEWIRPASTNLKSWQPAPHVAFPSYSFSVRRGAGMNLAVPVQGVPVGLSLLGSDAADGTVTIKQARTLGVDTISLWHQIQIWAKENADFLACFAPTKKETNYVRVITRVYACGQMDVSLRNSSSGSAGLDVGAPKPVNLLFPELPKGQTNTASAVAENYTNGWNTLQTILAKATEATGGNNFLPGGSLRLTAASARTIALQEQFDPPVILGFLGFDCAIGTNGNLWPPIPTHARLDPKSQLQSHANVVAFNTEIHQQIDAYHAIATRYNKANPAGQKQIRDWAKEAKLSATGEGAAWLQGLGEIVDGNDALKTGQFLKLKQMSETLKE